MNGVVLALICLGVVTAKPHHHNQFVVHGDSNHHHHGNQNPAVTDAPVTDAPTNDTAKVDLFIVGGTNAQRGEFPFIASLRQDNSHFCGGSLIESNGKFAILTAAHCSPNRVSTRYTVQLGAHFRSDSNTVDRYYYDTIVNHPQYNSNTLKNDIALIKLTTVPNLEAGRVESVALPAQGSKPVDGMDCTVSGWGTTSSGGSLAMTLQKVVKPIVSDVDCNNLYSAGGYSIDFDTMMCSGDTVNGGIDACQGDSGGPLVVYENGQAVQHGVVSWGIGCADSRYPGVYAEVNFFRNWIEQEMAKF